MARTALTSGLFVTVRSEGGLLPPDLLARIAANDPELPGLRPEDYGLARGERLGEAIARTWADVKTYWAAFQTTVARLGDEESGVSETREQWLLPLFRELGYGRLVFRGAAEEVGGRRYAISHQAGEGSDAPPIHTISFRQDLDRPAGAADGGLRVSPHGLVQEYLNQTDHLWGIVTNGRRLRLLRDNLSLTRAAFVEFDLEALLEGGVYADFVLLYLLLHRSRLPQPGEPDAACWLERWRVAAGQQGARALDALRDGVEAALRELGQGLLEHPANDALRERLVGGALPVADYYRQLLRLVYRLLFLLAAEERRLLFEDTVDQRRRDIYHAHYGVGRLRALVERRRAHDRYDDLWRGLQVTFGALSDERQGAALGLRPLAGGLFGPDSCPDLDGALVGNARLLAAVAGLAHARDPRTGLVRRVNYRDMDVEELGSVYEGLLELQPVLRTAGEYPTFDLGASGERKSTGSYYTNDGLVRELVASALDPVIADALARGRTAADKRANLLALKVCDPACGSGHFLLAAARGIGREVARLDAGDTEPDPREIRRGVREAIRHCVYGVDRNPLAVDLCKLALWLEGHDPGKPLGFLNARIKQGNSLVGTTFEMVGQPLPDDAFEPVIGDDKKIAASVRKRNRQERTGQLPFYPLTFASKDPAKYKHYRESLDHAPDTLEGVRASEHSYEDRQSWPDIRHRRLAFDLWTAAFFWPLVSGAAAAPTYAVVGKIAADRDALDCVADGDELAYDDPRAAAVSVLREARRLADDNGFFHWQLEFEDVFDRPDPGFDCILGNPPWERIKLQEQEFFAARDPEIANATNAAERKRKIEALREANPKLYAALVDAKRASEAESKFLRDAGRYPLTGRGDINTYSVFAEHMARTIRGRGRAGIIVPTGIATDDTNKHFFRWLVDGGRLASLYDFENREGLFSDVDSRTKFSLLTAAGAERPTAPFEAAFFLTQPDQLRDPARRFALDARDIALLNPNTRTCPIFRSQRDAVITLAVYRHVPSLSTQTDPHDWRASFFKKMIDFSVHADLIAFADDSPGSDWLPVYEAKMVHHFDHRFATYQGVSRRDRDVGNARAIEAAEKAIPTLAVKPRCWVTRETFLSRMRGKPWQQEWFVSVRDVARATDERTAIFAIRPGGPAVDKLPSLFVDGPACEIACLIGSLSSFAFDFVTRQKVGGANLGGYIIEQLPVLPRSTYTPVLLDQIVPRVLDLVYTANDLAPFARDCGYDGPPFTWDEERRAQLRADLDGLYAHLYGLSRDDFAYILDTFPIVRQKDEKRWGEYRTKRLCLEAYDRFAGDAAVASARAMAHVP